MWPPGPAAQPRPPAQVMLTGIVGVGCRRELIWKWHLGPETFERFRSVVELRKTSCSIHRRVQMLPVMRARRRCG